MIRRLAAEGLAVLVISSELEELVQVCDRVLALYEGRIVQELTGKQVTRVTIGHHIVGSQAAHE
jgi:ABC-type sugar transport system ATPase subunit